MTALQWLSTDLLTSHIGPNLPSITAVQDPFRRTIGQYETQTATLTITAKTNPAWLAATKPLTSALIAYRGAPGQEVIEWGGIVLRRQRTRKSNEVMLSLVTPEAYLDRRYAGDYTCTARDQNLILQDLVTQFAADPAGLPYQTSIIGPAGLARDEQIADKDDTTVYTRMQQAMAGGGPEFTGHWTWLHNPERIVPTITIGTRIGQATLPGLAPRAWFDTAMLDDVQLDEDYSSQKGANVVTATGPGQGNARPQATALLADMAGRPKVEYRWTPDSSQSDTSVLQAYANQGLNVLAPGAQVVSLTGIVGAAPQLGTAWNLGDDIGYSVDGLTFPGGLSGVGRCVSYEVSDTTIKPILKLPEVP